MENNNYYLRNPEDCNHPDFKIPDFDLEKAKKMTVQEVRKNYPRLHQTCKYCGVIQITYASYDHYILGDY